MDLRNTTIWQLACGLLAAISMVGCSYPEAGQYVLIGLNHTGEQVASFPFMVEEITDDSTMTTGFKLLWPKDRALVQVPLVNCKDTSARNWKFGISNDDTGLGSLDVGLEHFNSAMKFRGEYQALPTLEPWPIAGKVAFDARSTWLDFAGGLPYLPPGLSDVYSFELATISLPDFEEALGCSIDQASRVAQQPVKLDVIEESQPTSPKLPPKPAKPPTRDPNHRR